MIQEIMCFLKIENSNHIYIKNYFVCVITEVMFVKDPKPSSSEILFESVITLSYSGKLYNY